MQRNTNLRISNQNSNTGYLSRIELQEAIEDLTNQEFSMDHIEILYEEFDRSQDGKVDFQEFKIMMKYLENTVETTKRRKSVRMILLQRK